MEALLVEVIADFVSAAKLFDLTESTANVAAVSDLDSLAESRTRSKVQVLDRSNLWPVEAVYGV